MLYCPVLKKEVKDNDSCVISPCCKRCVEVEEIDTSTFVNYTKNEIKSPD